MTNIQRYYAVICTAENLFGVQLGACTQNCHTLPLFIDKFIDYRSWIKNISLDVLVCSIAEYLYSFLYLTRLTGSSKHSAALKNIQRYYAPKHLIKYMYIYSPTFKTARVAKTIWSIMNTIASIWCENMLGYLSLDIISSPRLTVFLELRSR